MKKEKFYKNIRWWQVLVIALITILATFALMSCDSTKDHYEDETDWIATHARNIEIISQMGSTATLTVYMPIPFIEEYQWNYKKNDVWIPFAYGKTVTHKFRESCWVRVHASSKNDKLWSNQKWIVVK